MTSFENGGVNTLEEVNAQLVAGFELTGTPEDRNIASFSMNGGPAQVIYADGEKVVFGDRNSRYGDGISMGTVETDNPSYRQ